MRNFLSQFPPWFLVFYAGTIALLFFGAYIDSEELGYPTIFLILSALSAVAISTSIICFALRCQHVMLRQTLRTFFPVAVIAHLWGSLLDAFVPTDYSLLVTGVSWLIDGLFIHAFVLPAYVIYYFYAYPANVGS